VGFSFYESIILERVFFGVESGPFVGAGDDFGRRFRPQHEVPGYPAFDIRHCRKIACGGKHGSFRLENHELTGAVVKSRGTDNPCSPDASFSQETGHHDAVENLNTKPNPEKLKAFDACISWRHESIPSGCGRKLLKLSFQLHIEKVAI
jgi:hypothetical protein